MSEHLANFQSCPVAQTFAQGLLFKFMQCNAKQKSFRPLFQWQNEVSLPFYSFSCRCSLSRATSRLSKWWHLLDIVSRAVPTMHRFAHEYAEFSPVTGRGSAIPLTTSCHVVILYHGDAYIIAKSSHRRGDKGCSYGGFLSNGHKIGRKMR